MGYCSTRPAAAPPATAHCTRATLACAAAGDGRNLCSYGPAGAQRSTCCRLALLSCKPCIISQTVPSSLPLLPRPPLQPAGILTRLLLLPAPPCHPGQTTVDRVYDRKNAVDLESQWFYRWIRDTYVWHVVAQFGLLYAFGGLPAVVWGGALRIVWVYHITWFVNSASHVWGSQTYNTGDLSRNNWWVGLLAFGEGEHGREGRRGVGSVGAGREG